jgi:toxin CcdB
MSPPAKICPVVEINDKPYVVMMHMMAGISVKDRVNVLRI